MSHLKRMTITAIVAFALTLTSLTVNAQMTIVDASATETIGELSPMGQTVISITKAGDIYTFSYRDSKFTHIDEFKSFNMNEESFNGLYNTIQSNIDKAPKEPITLTFENGIISLHFIKLLGVKSVQIYHSKTGDVIGTTSWITKKQLDKLFRG